MSVKTQRFVGVMLFLLGLALGLVSDLLASDEAIQHWYQAYRTWILSGAGLLILTGIILISISIKKGDQPTTPQKDGAPSHTTITSEDEEFLREQLARHQENRRQLLKQKSIYAAGEEPLHLLNQIAAEEKAIKEIEQQLRK